MARMTKEEAQNYLSAVQDGTATCPLCKLIAARIVIRYPRGVSEGVLDTAERILWSYKGTEKHS